ncbi:hypothetical protein ANO14919_088570 [Xylariales sp. No.14919]|nr:hypothetical protein ANO14919_088570 [Xylariales sp. No.14919]
MDPTLAALAGKPNNSRLRVLKHLARQRKTLAKASASRARGIATLSGGDGEEDPNRPAELAPGMMRLYSYYSPSLQGGMFDIVVNHSIETKDGASKNVTSKQQFHVDAPRFSLPADAVHSVYPPQGLGDHNNILPHIVFNDPHFPWLREGSPKQEMADLGIKPRNKVPWVALLSFTEDELRLNTDQLKGKAKGGLFPDTVKIPPKTIPEPPEGTREQDKSTFSVKLTMEEYLEMGVDGRTRGGKVIAPIAADRDEEAVDPNAQVDVIFLRGDLMTSLLASYNNDGSVEKSNDVVVGPDLSRYKYLAHVRNVNTRNIAGAGLDDNGLFSVLFGHRSGPLDGFETSRPVIVHLVTLEGLEVVDNDVPHFTWPPDPSKRYALVSLYSWTYLCLPPEEVNFVNTMRDIGASIKLGECWLRASDDVIAQFTKPPNADDPKSPPPALQNRLVKRLEDGYTLQRYKLHTGEETVAFYRGPLTPRWTPPVKDWWPFQSSFATDYQVLDRSMGIMDITYSAAWQLGRTLGMADQAFTAALVRLRGAVQTTGRRAALKDQAPQQPKTKTETLRLMQNSITTLSQLAVGDAGATKSKPLYRCHHKVPKAVRFAPVGARRATVSATVSPYDVHRSLLRKQLNKAAKFMGSAKVDNFRTTNPGAMTAVMREPLADGSNDEGNPTEGDPAEDDPVEGDPHDGNPSEGNSDNDDVYIPFNEINIPSSPDWQMVQAWILDKLFLKNIPAHYYISDASYLPPESIRFFYIDNNWIDALIDGALSIGNHLDRNDDVVRQAFKRNLNRYFENKYHPNHPALQYYPQIPCFGFLLRSAVVKAFPDLEISAPWKPPSDDDAAGVREPTLRYEAIAKDTLLCLFDRMPGSSYWEDELQITLSQPPHQQCFRLGTGGGLTDRTLQVQFRPVYTTEDTPFEADPAGQSRYDTLRIVTWNKTGLPSDPSVPKAVFDWDSRMIVFPAMANTVHNVLTVDMERDEAPGTQPKKRKYFVDDTPTSAVVGTVLNSFISKIRIKLPETTITAEEDLPPDYTKEPRQIRLPPDASEDPDDWVRVPDVDDSDEGSVPPSEGEDEPPPTHESPPAPLPSHWVGLPKGYNQDEDVPVPESEWTRLSLLERLLYIDLLPNPQFKFQAFPLGMVPKSPTLPIPGLPGPGLPLPGSALSIEVMMPVPGSSEDHGIDFVFALTRHPTLEMKFNLQLFSIVIEIPVGTKKTDLLAPDGTGTARGRMLKNLRFNVHAANEVREVKKDQEQSYLVMTLIPRAQSRLVPLRVTKDASFALWPVKLNGVEGVSTIRVRENYRRRDHWDSKPRSAWGENVFYVAKKSPES